MFIVSPRIGLCNQLYAIVKGILLGIKYNRNVYIDRFQTNLYSNNFCNINEILNIEKINAYLTSKYIYIKVLNSIDENIINNIDNYKLPNLDYNNISNIHYINNLIDNNLNQNIIYLGNIVSICIYKIFENEYDRIKCEDLFNSILSNIMFHDKFYEMKENIKNTLNLINYATVHLRIEDDAINYFSECYKLTKYDYNNKLLLFYNQQIRNITKNIYICSGILTYDNILNFDYYKNLIKNNYLICDKCNLHINDYYLNNRELIAIIDLLIAYDSDEFVGSAISSFSNVISIYLKYHKKISSDKINLFNI